MEYIPFLRLHARHLPEMPELVGNRGTSADGQQHARLGEFHQNLILAERLDRGNDGLLHPFADPLAEACV